LASLLLWVLWPSFVTALLPADQVNWGMITCYMAGLGSIISAYVMCMIYEKKVNPLVYTYALLAGPVAIGSCLLVVGPWGALLIGIVFSAVGGLVLGLVRFQGVASLPPSLSPTFLQLDFSGLLSLELITVVIVFLYLDIFDTVGTLVGVAHQAGLMKDGELPRSERALFADATVDVVTVAFGVRNFADLALGLSELVRVLRPGGALLVLEFSQPRGPMAPVLEWWARSVPPRIGRWLSGDPDAYSYLPASVSSFPEGGEMCRALENAGLRNIEVQRLTGGVASLYEGKR